MTQPKPPEPAWSNTFGVNAAGCVLAALEESELDIHAADPGVWGDLAEIDPPSA